MVHQNSAVYLIILILVSAQTVRCTKLGTCIMNCGQCKQMYGHYFQGQVCAEACLTSGGMLLPDCNKPNTLLGFLKRLY